MDLTCGFGEWIRGRVFNLIWKQLLYVVCYHHNIEELNKQLVELSLKRSSIQHQIDEAIEKAEKIEDKVVHWMEEVRKISDQVEELRKESQSKRECSITSCPNPWLRRRLSERAEEIAKEAVRICEVGENFNRVSYRVPLQPMPELTSRESNEGIRSRERILNEIMEALRNPSVNMIGLCGPPGVGKTTIAGEVEKNQNIFEKAIKAKVSDKLNVEKIQGQIAEKLGMQLNDKTEDVRAYRLCQRLKQENMLLILDDLWEELDLGKVGIPFLDFENSSKKKEGCKILLTSRDEGLLSKRMKCQKVIKVGALSKKEALELFKRIAELSTDSSNAEFINVATKIVRKFKGLPLAIATAAKALKGEKDLKAWKDALNRLENASTTNITGIKEVDSVLKMSYYRLSSSPDHQLIFLLAAMLSHDTSIEDLLMYSVGLDILKHTKNMEDAHIGISVIVSRLKSLNLFLDSSSSHHFTMHDLFRAVALSIAIDELPAYIVRHEKLKAWPDENRLKGCKGICLQENEISGNLPKELHAPNMEFFLLNSTKRDLAMPNMFFKSSNELKVLEFTNVHFTVLPSLNFLQKLSTLCLRSCLLEDITELRNLKNLKVLNLAYSEIEQLPFELAELTSLQMLNLAHCYKLKVIPQKILSSLENLEVLYMGNSFNQWKFEGSGEANENASLDELKDLPISSLDIHIPNVSMLPKNNLFLYMNLKRYRIFFGNHWEWHGNYEASKILKLELENSIHLQDGVQKLLEGVEELYLYGSNGLENILYSQDGRPFPHLTHLEIEGNDDIKNIVSNSAHHEGAQNNASNKVFESLFNNKVFLPKLEILKLSDLSHMIPLIWNDQLSHSSFINLKTLAVKSCGFVKLVPIHVLKFLNNLEELEVGDCDMLEMVFDFEDLNDYTEMEPSSSPVVVPLKKLTLWKLPKLKNVWSNHHQGIVSFQSLKSIQASDCESLISMFPASIAKGILHDLEILIIYNCGIDVIVAKDQVSEYADATFEFPKLTLLFLLNLPNLRNFYPQRCTLEWPHLRDLNIQYCDELEIFEKEISSSCEIHEEESTGFSKYPLLSHTVIPNLEGLGLGGKEAEMIGSGQFPMYHFPKVKFLVLHSKKATTISYASLKKGFPNLEEMQLHGDFKKEASGANDIAPFSKLTLINISNMISSRLSLISSSNLTHLKVISNKLTTLMTSSAARSLTHLTHLSIISCYEMEGIISNQGEDDEVKEIIFSKLEFLELHFLPRLKRFCCHNYTFIFPLLEHVAIRECPQLTMFCPGVIRAPLLRSVRLDLYGRTHKDIWMTDLNSTIEHHCTTHEVIPTIRSVALNPKNITMIKDVFPEVRTLHVVSFTDKGMAFPYSSLERFPKLKRLSVEHCSFEEIFSSQDLSIWNDSQISSIHQKLTSLQVKSCSNLIRLSQPSCASFQNLRNLTVSGCHELRHLVTISTAKSLASLKWLEINDCKKMEEIVMNETIEDVQAAIIIFNQLWEIEISDMPSLKMFSSQSHNFQFPKLTEIKITGCPEMKMFCRGVLETPNLSKVKIGEHDMKWKAEGDINKTIQMLSLPKDNVDI